MLGKLFRSREASFKGLLQWWIIGGGLLLSIAYLNLLFYYFIYGVKIKTTVEFEHYAQRYTEELKTNPNAALPRTANLISYADRHAIPDYVANVFLLKDPEHGEVEVIAREDDDDGISTLAKEQLLNNFCKPTPCEIAFFYTYQIDQDKWLYMLQGMFVSEEILDDKMIVEEALFAIASSLLMIFVFLAYQLTNKISRPVQRLSNWAEHLSLNNLDEKNPDFCFRELNLVSNRLKTAFERLSDGMKKEHRFLQHASHELRTPLAVAAGNLDILNMLVRNREVSSTEQSALLRLNDAIKDMQQLTETLLWLNRNEDSMRPPKSFALKGVIEQLVDDHRYLLDAKPVEVHLQGDDFVITTQSTLCKIVIANLIRNAFQYTQEGSVNITLQQDSIVISNINDNGFCNDSEEDYGFGLGLELVSQISSKLGWNYQYESLINGRASVLLFNDFHQQE